MGCQKTIAREIHDADADDVRARKANHEVLHEEIKTFLDDALDHPRNLPTASRPATLEKDHGRIETRRTLCPGELHWLADRAKWTALRSVAGSPAHRPPYSPPSPRLARPPASLFPSASSVVEAARAIDGQTSRERRSYLSSLPPHAPELARAIRGHWGLENSRHWVLDVARREDECRVRTGHAATHLATLRHLALNLLRQDTTKKRGIRTKQKIAGGDHRYLIKLLAI